ncbi:MAG: hypothetical protein IKF64_00090, partial [Eubacterium sp.]|nr:hypothetical protein [Eubacterium sp.]
MKRQIDPNLAGNGEVDILNSVKDAGISFSLEESDAPALSEADGESEAKAPADDYQGLKEDIRSYQEAIAEAEKEEHHHHH